MTVNRFGFADYPASPYEKMYWTGQLVRILQVVVPLAAAKQLGVLEERLRLAREKVKPSMPGSFYVTSYDDKKSVEDYEAALAWYLDTSTSDD